MSEEAVGKASHLFNNLDENQSLELLEYIKKHKNVSYRLDMIEEIGVNEIFDMVNGLEIEGRIMNITIRDLGDVRMHHIDIVQRFESSQPSGPGVYSQENIISAHNAPVIRNPG